MSTIITTLIEVRDFAIGPDLYRRRASDLSDWDDLIEYTFNAFNRDERYFRLHFHFSRETHCIEDELLSKDDWNDGIYFVGARRLFFAHFVTRARHEPRGYYKRRQPSPSPASPTPEPGSPVVPWTMPPLPPMNEQGRTIPQLHLLLRLHVVQQYVLAVDLDVDLHVDADVDAHHNPLSVQHLALYHHQLNPFQPSVDPLLSDQTPTQPMYTPLVHRYRLIDTQTQGPLFQVQTQLQLDLRLRHQLQQYPFVHLLPRCCLLDQLFANRLHPGTHQPTAPLPPPPPPQSEDYNMELADDPISDSDAQNTPLPAPTYDEYADLQYPVIRPSPEPRYEGQTDDEQEDLTLQSPLYPIPEFEERPDNEYEDLTLQSPLYPGSEFEQPPDEEEDPTLQSPLYSNSEFEQPPDNQIEDEQMSIAPTSPGSGGLFVRDETEAQNFEAALAWEDDGTQQSVVESELGQEEERSYSEDGDAMTFIASPSAAPSSAVPTSAGTGLFVSDGSETRGFAEALEWEEDDADDDDEEMEDEGEGGVEVRRR
ncbi:hypothetical protein J4E85_010299 [Alternaria conjuncta]|uniref:uncharacterized protein n=1 Tax=Alternaria conjuncta TaxID=181017 RepID=UPI00221EB011|nr:uncharacterized protein J4E85_010299 [Alternaria conjuncta]KAI4916211.1 hypothetical protein J4E85_010299 [Alternaria conjuncta]